MKEGWKTVMKQQKLVEKMTIEEKAAFLSGKTVWQTREIDRLSIPSIFLSDGPHGIRKQAGAGDHLGLNASLPATCFPTAAGVANSWDEALGEEIGEALAEEAVTMGVNVILGPGLNIKRSPLCGRNFEYFSEDPYHAGKMQQPMCVESRVKESLHVRSTLRQTARSLQMDPGGRSVRDRQQPDHSAQIFTLVVPAVGICRTSKSRFRISGN